MDELGPDGTPSARQRLAWVALILTEWVELQDDVHACDIWRIANGKPVGAVSELVDIWIRCADTLGACGEPLEGAVAHHVSCVTDHIVYALGSAAESTRIGDHVRYAAYLRYAMSVVERTIQASGAISFEAALAAKEAYNRTRSQRHGGKLA